MLMLFLLRPTTKPYHCDITMHAPYFLSRGRGETLTRVSLPVTKKEGKGKGKRTIGPGMKNGGALCTPEKGKCFPVAFLKFALR